LDLDPLLQDGFNGLFSGLRIVFADIFGSCKIVLHRSLLWGEWGAVDRLRHPRIGMVKWWRGKQGVKSE